MLVKFETKSQRVKGISFHHSRPWLLASLHSGEIQLWDYRIGSLLEKFEEHEGPVRSVVFHKIQPLFVSGGDDYKIKGWNYKTKKCIFTLKGHLDYIRTVQFHHELPWVLSSSDDQTIRLWNYQSRTLISILTGHNHYVMCAQFHPSKDLIISCSLDQTLRLWDFSMLRKKYTSAGASKNKPNETLGGSEVEVKAILEGHDRGVNWCCFHPTLNLIASAADDRKIKLWKYTESKAWEHDSLYGHSNNVSCVVFQDKLDVIVSNSEDKTIKVWDLNRRICMDTFKRDNDRFWILAVHPELHYIAAGSDSGLIVFNLQTERIPAAINGNDIFIVHKKQLIHRELQTGKETILKQVDHTPSTTSLVYQKPNQIYYNHFNTNAINILVLFKDKEKLYYKYFLYTLPNQNIEKSKSNITSAFRYALGAVFVGKDKFAFLKLSRDVDISDINEQGEPKTINGIPPVDMIYPGPLGKIVLKTEDSVILYDITNKKIINQVDLFEVSKLKRVIWSSNYNYCALLCKKNLVILNKNFTVTCIIQEKFNINSATWNNDNVLIYTTTNHLKYALLNGDYGILRCLDSPVYIIKANDTTATTMDRDANIVNIVFDKEEYLFKLALHQKDTKKIKFLMENHKRLGNSIISYLYKKNYSAIALNLVQNTRARFSLALDSGNLEVAYKTSFELKDLDCYTKLGDEALRQGNHQIVEVAYQNIRNYEKLAFLYLITGNFDKLNKMLTIAQKRNDVMSRFHNSLYIGNIEERIRILAEVGLLHLAYLSAVTHNLQDLAEPLKQSVMESLPSLDILSQSEALIPPKPLILDASLSPQIAYNWPHHQLQEEDLLVVRSEVEPEEVVEPSKTGFDLDVETTDAVPHKDIAKEDKNIEHDNWGIEDLDIPDIDMPESTKPSTTTTTIAVNNAAADYTEGKDLAAEKAKNSQLAGELAAFGYFELAKNFLKKQISVANPDLFNQALGKVYASSNLSITGLPLVVTNPHVIASKENLRPLLFNSIETLEITMNKAYQLTTTGKFQDAINTFREVLLSIPLLVLQDQAQESQIHSMIRICIEYIVGLRCEVSRKQLNMANPNEAVRGLELLAYMSMANMQPAHRILALRSSMTIAYKLENFIYAAFFSKKLAQIAEANSGCTSPEIVASAKKVYMASEQKGTNSTKITFEESWLHDQDAILRICGKTLKVLKGKDIKKCPYCKANFSGDLDGEVCEVCCVSKIGAECLGLKLF